MIEFTLFVLMPLFIFGSALWFMSYFDDVTLMGVLCVAILSVIPLLNFAMLGFCIFMYVIMGDVTMIKKHAQDNETEL